MTKPRIFQGRDMTYSDFHRDDATLSKFEETLGHRSSVADRDWTEYCQDCRAPLALLEEKRMRRELGIEAVNLHAAAKWMSDCDVETSRILGTKASVPVVLFSWHSARSRETQREIDQLNRRIRQLEQQDRIDLFAHQSIGPLKGQRGRVEFVSPRQWVEFVAEIHGRHARDCGQAEPVHWKRLQAKLSRGNPLLANGSDGDQMALELPGANEAE